MDAALIASAALLGLAGAPHCTLMCSAPCAAAQAGGGPAAGPAFHLGRVASYAAAGALAAASVSALAHWSQLAPALRPAWTLVHASALVFGLSLLWRGRQPRWLSDLSRIPETPPASQAWRLVRGPGRAAVSGGLWAAWPCGLLQSALLVAAMSSGGLAGASAMAAFALASAPGLVVGPWLWLRLLGRGNPASRERWASRIAGLSLTVASSWALAEGLVPRFAAFCATL